MTVTRKTRAKGSDHDEAVTSEAKAELQSTSNPPLLFILPRERSEQARIVNLPAPATQTANKYLFDPDHGLYEFIKIAAPKKTPRSWLLGPDTSSHTSSQQASRPEIPSDSTQDVKQSATETTSMNRGYSLEQPDLFLATPMDPVFFLLPGLAIAAEGPEQIYLSLSDHLDSISERHPHVDHLRQHERFYSTLIQRADAICDTVDAIGEKMYRLSSEKLFSLVLSKARAMTEAGLPASLEQKFVQEALRVPVTNVVAAEEPVEASTSQDSTVEETSQVSSSTVHTNAINGSQESTTVYTPATTTQETNSRDQAASAEVTNLLRLRTSLNFILQSYIPPPLRTHLQERLSSSASPIDWAPLDNHLSHLASLRKQAQALRFLSDNISRKRSGFGNDDEQEEARNEKRRKKEEEETRKKNQSHGVKRLAKVNTSGMKKMSSFFTAVPAKKAKG